MKTIKDIVYASCDEAQKLDLYLPEGEVKCVFLYIHGGGLEYGDKYHGNIMASFLTEKGVALASIGYRKYPNAEYPQYIYDSAMAVKWTYDYMVTELGCDKLYVGGSSAGGYLSMMLCFDKRYLESVGLTNQNIAGYFHDAGQPTAHFKILSESGFDSRRVIVDETTPLYYVGVEKEYPPMRFIVSTNDMQNRYEQTMLLLSTLKHFGYTGYDHVVMDGTHCHYCGQLDENGVSKLGKMVYDFIKSVNLK